VEALGLGPLARTILQFKSEGLRAVDSMRLGREAFAHALKNAAPLGTRVRIDEADLEEEVLLVEVMNIQHAGSRVRLAPQADTGDGLFDVVTIGPAQRADFLAWLAQGSERDPPPVTWRRARSVAFDWRGEPLHIDDHGPVAEAQEGRVTVRFATQRLTVLVPSLLDREAAKNPAPTEGMPQRRAPGGPPALERETS
jgi:diacylglycerol kinase family enzyme